MKWMKIISREYGVQYTEVSLRCLSEECKDLLPEPIYSQIYVPDNQNEVCFFHEENWNNLVQSLEKEYSTLPKLKEYEKLFVKLGEEYLNTSEKIASKNLSALENSELADLYEQYYKAQLPYCTLIWTSFIINNLVSKKASDILSKYFENMVNEAELYKIALSPRGQAAVFKLQEHAAAGKDKTMLFEEYKWMSCLDLHNDPWTMEEFEDYLANLKPLEKHSITYDEFISQLAISDEDKKMIDIAKGFAYLKDIKDDFRRKSVFLAQKLFSEIGKRIGIGTLDMSYVLKNEIMDFLQNGGKFDSNIIAERKNGFSIYYDSDRNIQCEHGDKALSIIQEFNLPIEEAKTDELIGTIASKGTAKGKVVIVRGVADLKKVKKGDILVAVTTHPDYVTAIVTDEGGVTCHAAIVSRELGVPCLVGTKTATKVLKDGDGVEVNAELGFVKKI
jgi:phosphohistidine swiveling domain-containing protein